MSHAGRERIVVSKDETRYRRVDFEPPVLQTQHQPTDRGGRRRAHVNQPLDSWLRPRDDEDLTHVVKHALPYIGDTPSAPDPDAVPGVDDPPKLAKSAKTEEEALGHYRRVRDEIRQFVETLPDGLHER